MAPGLPKQGPPWGIEGEPGGSRNSTLKRPFEANNEGDMGHHKNQPCGTKTPLVPLTSNHHTHRAHTCHRNATLKSPTIFILRPIKRARNWRRTTHQCTATFTWQRVTPPSHTCHSLHHTAHAGQTAPSPSDKAEDFSPLHERCISPQCSDCVQNEGECRTQRICAHIHVCSVPLRLLVDYSLVLGSAYLAVYHTH